MSTALVKSEPPPNKLTAYGYTIELFSDYICIFDPKGTLTKAGSQKLADWVVSEGFKQKPFEVKVFKASN